MIEFSRNGYVNLMDTFRQRRYQFRCFNELGSIEDGDARYCLLRHDVDISMDHAYEMAQLESGIGVCATYFVMLRSPMYNLFSRHCSEILRKIVQLGHEIGLHYDAGHLQGSERSIEQWVGFEVSTLAALAGTKITAFSFHQPTKELLDQKFELAGLTNTYNSEHLSSFKYLSDSNRMWREFTPVELIDIGEKRIQFLAHPIWWMSEFADIQDCWDSAIVSNFKRAENQLLSTERTYVSPRKLILQRPPS